MARWWYYCRSPRTTLRSFPLKIYLSELARISSVKTKITWFIFEASHFTNEWKEVSPISADIKARYSAQSWRSLSAIWSYFINCPLWHIYFYRTRVRSLFTLVTNSLTHWLTHSLLFSKLYWCDPGVRRCQLKTYWGCCWCWCWLWGACWQQFIADLEAEVWSYS